MMDRTAFSVPLQSCVLCDADIVARLKRHQGYNVLHPIGFDAFGLPAEQFAIQTGAGCRGLCNSCI